MQYNESHILRPSEIEILTFIYYLLSGFDSGGSSQADVQKEDLFIQ